MFRAARPARVDALRCRLEGWIAQRSSAGYPPFNVWLIHTFPLRDHCSVLVVASMHVHALPRMFVDEVRKAVLSGYLLPIEVLLIDAVPLGNRSTVLT